MRREGWRLAANARRPIEKEKKKEKREVKSLGRRPCLVTDRHALLSPQSSKKGRWWCEVVDDRYTSIQMRHCDVHKKLCKKGSGDQLRHPQRSPLQRFRQKKEGIVVTVGRRSAAGGRVAARDARREDAE